MPFCCCGLFSKRHSSEEQQDEKAVPVSNISSTSTTAPKPKKVATTSSFKEIDWTPVEKGLTIQEEEKPDTPTTINGDNTELAKVEKISSTKDDENAPMADQLKGAASGVTNTVSSGAQKASEGAQSAASSAQNATAGATGQESWNAMSEEQKEEAFNALPKEQKDGHQTYYEWVAAGLAHQKENWMPWIEDQYLKWFTNDNKASYATKDAMDKTKVTGIDQVDTLQDSVNHTVAGQVGKGGLLQPVGDMASSEGINRAERGGKDDKGSYLGSAGSAVSSAGGSVWSGAKNAGGYVGGMFGGKKEEGGTTEESK